MKPYAVDLRERLLWAIDAGLGQAEAGRLFGVGTSSIKRWRRQRAAAGAPTPNPRPGRTPCIGPAQAGAPRAQVAAAPDATLAAHCAEWERAQGARERGDDVARHAPAGHHGQTKPSAPPSGMRTAAPRGGRRWSCATRRCWSSSTRAGRTSP